MRDFDIIIAGAGPAGSSLAILLGKAGFRVLLADRFRFPRDKICGECISPGAYTVLEKLGIREKLEESVTETITGVTFYSPSGIKKILSYPENKTGFAVSRRKLDKFLLEEAESHPSVNVMEGMMVKKLVIETGQVIITASKEKQDYTFSAKLLVAADGRYSTIAKLQNNYRIIPEYNRYVYVATLENVKGLSSNIELIIQNRKLQFLISRQAEELASIAVVINEKNYDKSAVNQDTFIELLKGSGVIGSRLGDINFETRVKGIILQRYRLNSLVSDRVIYIGDTTGFIDPITGEGMYRAFKSAELAGETIKEAFHKNSFTKKELFSYQKNLLREFNPVYRFIKTAVFMTSNEYVADFIIKRMKEDSKFARKLVSLQGAIIPGRELYSPETLKLCLQLFNQ